MRLLIEELFVLLGLGYTAWFLQQTTPEFTFASVVIVTMMIFAIREVVDQYIAYRVKAFRRSMIPPTLIQGLAVFAVYILIGLVAFNEKYKDSTWISVFATVALLLMTGYAIKYASQSWLLWFSGTLDTLAMRQTGVGVFDEYLEKEQFRQQMSNWMGYWIVCIIVAIVISFALPLPSVLRSGLFLILMLLNFTKILNDSGDDPSLVRVREGRIRKWMVSILVVDGLLCLAPLQGLPLIQILSLAILMLQLAAKVISLIVFLIQLYILRINVQVEREMSKLDPPSLP